MKKIFYSLISGLAFAVLLGACEKFNDQFEGLDAKTKITNVAAYNYTLGDADYSAISKSALAVASNTAETNNAKSIASNKYFTNTVPSSLYVPYLLATKYPYSDLGSTAMITSSFGEDRPTYLTDYANASSYTLVKGDYVSSGSTVLGFYPEAIPANFLAAVLTANVTAPTEGKIEVVKYTQYTQTPVISSSTNYLLDENFNYGSTAGNLTTVNTNWTAHSGAGSALVGYATTSLSMAGYPSSGIGGSATIAATGVEDINRTFASQTSGTIYLSALVNLSAVGTGAYFLHLMDDAFGYPARVSAKDDGTGKILFGIGAGSTITYGTTPFNLNTTYLLVASYDIASGVANLYVLSSAVATKPATAEVTSTVSPTVLSVQKVAIRQASGGPAGIIEGVRVTTSWNALMVNDVVVSVSGNKMNREVYYQYTGGKWIPSQGIYVLTTEDYQSMGTATGQPGKYGNFDSTMPPENYLPTFLAKLFPYAQSGNKQIVAYKYYSGGTQTRVDEYLFKNGVWSKPSSVVSKTEQFIYSNAGWVFDPTVKMTMVQSDYQLMVDYVLATPSLAKFALASYHNEEFYYGFGSRYSNVSLRLSYRNPFFSGADLQPATIDPELSALTTDAEKVALLWTRLKGGMAKFLQLRYPAAVPNVSGIDVFYHATTYVYYPNGVTSGYEYHKYIFKCTAAASGGNPPTFEFVSESIVN